MPRYQHFSRQMKPLGLFTSHKIARHHCSRTFASTLSPQDPLKILFCGADEFSIYSLKGVFELRSSRPDCIASIDVVCRPDKKVGRGLQHIREVPLKAAARDLSLPVHQIDTFTGWDPDISFDLVVAVSFGLLVPLRILRSATFGGINVHPSLLPDLRGPAPIQHALLQARTHTGVSLQTMHPSRFDHGRVLAQTTRIPIGEQSTTDDLIRLLGPLGATILCSGIENRIWAKSDHQSDFSTSTASESSAHAPKITPEDRHIDWKTWTADRILRYDRAVGRLWDSSTYQQCNAATSNTAKRITYDGPWRAVSDTALPYNERRSAGSNRFVIRDAASKQYSPFSLTFRTCDDRLIVPAFATIEGERRQKGLETLYRILRN